MVRFFTGLCLLSLCYLSATKPLFNEGKGASALSNFGHGLHDDSLTMGPTHGVIDGQEAVPAIPHPHYQAGDGAPPPGPTAPKAMKVELPRYRESLKADTAIEENSVFHAKPLSTWAGLKYQFRRVFRQIKEFFVLSFGRPKKLFTNVKPQEVINFRAGASYDKTPSTQSARIESRIQII